MHSVHSVVFVWIVDLDFTVSRLFTLLYSVFLQFFASQL